MTSLYFDEPESIHNPIDVAEELLTQRGWPCERASTEELAAEFVGSWCDIRVWLTWHVELGGLFISCNFDGKIPEKFRDRVYPLLAKVNEKLWLGHFMISSDDGAICFRHTLLCGAVPNAEMIEEVLDIAHHECERFYPVLQSVVWGGQSAEDAFASAIFETVGEA